MSPPTTDAQIDKDRICCIPYTIVPDVAPGIDMTIVCEVAFAATRADNGPDAAPDLARHWTRLPGLLTFDLYVPAGEVQDPYVRDGTAPVCLAMLGFASLDSLDRAVRNADFSVGVSEIGTGVLSCTAMRRSHHPVGTETEPATLEAPFSYVVRYYRPAMDDALFVRHYIETHPPLLARLPEIRNVMCYVPLRWRGPAGLPSADYLIGNEVVFEHQDAFNAALMSPVRHELRADYYAFPAYSGRNTHFPMHRARLFG